MSKRLVFATGAVAACAANLIASCASDEPAANGRDGSPSHEDDASSHLDGSQVSDGASPLADGAGSAIALPTGKVVYVTIGVSPTVAGGGFGNYEIRIYPPEFRTLPNAACESQVIDSCYIRSCVSGLDAGVDAGQFESVLSGTLTVTNETGVAQARDAQPNTQVVDVGASRVGGFARAPVSVELRPDDNLHITWVGATGLPPIDTRMKVPRAANAQFETDPGRLSESSPTRIVWLQDPSQLLVRLTPATTFGGRSASAYCAFDQSATREGSISPRVVTKLGYCVDGGPRAALAQIPGVAIRPFAGTPLSVLLALEEPLIGGPRDVRCKQ